jgi:hypothetical protein
MCSEEERDDVAYDVIPMSYTNKDEHGRVESRTWLASTQVLGELERTCHFYTTTEIRSTMSKPMDVMVLPLGTEISYNEHRT